MNSAALPSYSVRESKRAKHVRLQISLEKGLVVVVPEGFNHKHIPSLLNKRKTWLDKHLRRIDQAARHCENSTELGEFPPKVVHLRALNQVWHITRREQNAAEFSVTIPAPGELLLSGAFEEASLRAFFDQWLRQQAREHFLPKLAEISARAGLHYQTARIRCQKTRWGSCSSKGGINLNYKLLFLPAPVARYVMLHELAHLRHLNHSAAFWRLVESMEPDYLRWEGELKEAWRYVPLWVGR